MRILTVLLATLLLSLQFALWAGDKNFFDLNRIDDAIALTAEDNQKLASRNQRLLAEVVDLKEGGETMETLARSELGLIKPEETFYQIIQSPD